MEDAGNEPPKTRSSSVVMIPYLAHGHVSPFLRLAHELSGRNFRVYFSSTAVILDSIKGRVQGNPAVELVELRLPVFPDLPPHYHSTKSLPLHLHPTLDRAFEAAGPVLSAVLRELGPDLVVYDVMLPWVPPLAWALGVPAVAFSPTGAAVVSVFFHLLEHGLEGVATFPFPQVYLRRADLLRMTRLMPWSVTGTSLLKQVKDGVEASTDIVLFKSLADVEEKYADRISRLTGKMIVPVGPLLEDHDDESDDITEWLNEKDSASTIFVSFGSECYLTKEEREEIAHGLELSQVSFIWVVRFPHEEEEPGIEEAFPEGFLERVKDRGRVIMGWAPQVRVLSHPSIGGFVSHCGFGSITESIAMGVPIIAMPMQYEQPMNARMAVEAGVGVEVGRTENGEYPREEIARAIRGVVAGEGGEVIRRKVRDLSEKIRAGAEGELNEAAKELEKLCRRAQTN